MTAPQDRHTQLTVVDLFPDLPEPSAAPVVQAQTRLLDKRSQGSVRLLQPNRTQIELRASDLESLLAPDHRARLVCSASRLEPRDGSHQGTREQRRTGRH